MKLISCGGQLGVPLILQGNSGVWVKPHCVYQQSLARGCLEGVNMSQHLLLSGILAGRWAPESPWGNFSKKKKRLSDAGCWKKASPKVGCGAHRNSNRDPRRSARNSSHQSDVPHEVHSSHGFFDVVVGRLVERTLVILPTVPKL